MLQFLRIELINFSLGQILITSLVHLLSSPHGYSSLSIHIHSLYLSSNHDLILYMANEVINASSIHYHFISMECLAISFSNNLCHQFNKLIVVINLSSISYHFDNNLNDFQVLISIIQTSYDRLFPKNIIPFFLYSFNILFSYL